jgi:hypothetical protein
MPAITRRILAGSSLLLLAFSPVVLGAERAGAFPEGDSVISFNYNIVATTHIKKADQTITIGGGKFNGEVDFDKGQLAGHIKLPPVTFTFNEAGIGLVTATAQIKETKPVSGKVNLKNFKVTATSTFNMLLLSMYAATPKIPTVILPLPLPISLPPLPLPKVNLVGNNCTTSVPISVTMSGIAHLDSKSTFNGTFQIPDFKNCSLATTALNQLVPGPGNTFSATANP